MPKCTRQGCQKEFDEDKNEEGACLYHSGRPKFHEGLKSWTCCEDTNRPVLDFNDFMKIPGCTPGTHTAATNLPVAQPVQTSGDHATSKSSTTIPNPASNTSLPTSSMTQAKQTTEGTDSFTSLPSSTQPTNFIAPATSKPVQPLPPPPEDEDDVDVPVSEGSKCLRNGCKHTFVSQEVSRGEGESSECVYHPLPPIFHEGSKGYLCCKRRVLEFNEFLKIQGCKTGKHVFVKKKRDNEGGSGSEELVQCRVDHYQTPTQVLASVYAKKVDANKSTIVFEDERVHLDLFLPGADEGSWKRFTKTLELFGPVKAQECKFSIKGTKVDLILPKQDARSWTLLEKTDADLGGISITFGVGGRTGTIGGKDIVLDADNKLRQ